MKYENKTIEELIDLLEGRDDQIEEIEQSNKDLADEIKTAKSDNKDYEDAIIENEEKYKKSFDAGYDACCCGSEQLKGWLNFKVDNML